jgi:hypothetical protein
LYIDAMNFLHMFLMLVVLSNNKRYVTERVRNSILQTD